MIKMILYCIATSFAISYILSRYLLRNADRLRLGKRVYSERVRLHKKGVPRLGGMAIGGAFFVTFLAFYILNRENLKDYDTKFYGILLSSALIIACGLYDDLIRRLSYRIKFVVQILAIIIIIVFGYNINILTNPFDGKIYIGMLGIPLVILWMLMIMNAINLMDGLDGLACGISIIAALSFLTMVFYQGNIFPLLIVACFMGASLAFLRFNFYPARLFLGDSGSFFLGFILGILAIESATKGATVISLIVPLLALLIPIASVIFTFSRRIAYARNPFKADKKHMHYRFLHAGLSHRDTVLIYYTVCFFYAVFGTYCFFMPKKFELAIITFAGITMWGLYMWALHFVNTRERLHRENSGTKKS